MKKAFIDDSEFRHYIFGELMKRAKLEEETKQFQSYEDFIGQLFSGVYFEEWSLDHDLGYSSMDGTAALVLLFGNKNHDGILPKAMYPKWICIHSHNDSGSWRMYNLIPDCIPTTVSRFDYSGWERPKGMKVNGPTQYDPAQAPRAFHSSEEAKERSAIQRGYGLTGCNQPLSIGSTSYGGTSYPSSYPSSSSSGYWDSKANKWVDDKKDSKWDDKKGAVPKSEPTEKICYQQLPLHPKGSSPVEEKHPNGALSAQWRQSDAVRWEMLSYMEDPDDAAAIAEQTKEVIPVLNKYRVYYKEIPDNPKMRLFTYVDADKHEAFSTEQTSLTDADNAFSKFLYDEEEELRQELKHEKLAEDAEAAAKEAGQTGFDEADPVMESEETPDSVAQRMEEIAARNAMECEKDYWEQFGQEHGDSKNQEEKPPEKDGNTILL